MTDQKKITEADCAYLAALIDQRGVVKVRVERRRFGPYRTIILKLTRLQRRTVQWVNERFGPVSSVLRHTGGEITFVSRTAAEICVHAYPYLVEMKESARLVTRFAQSIGQQKSPLTPEREEIRNQVEQGLQEIERARKGRR